MGLFIYIYILYATTFETGFLESSATLLSELLQRFINPDIYTTQVTFSLSLHVVEKDENPVASLRSLTPYEVHNVGPVYRLTWNRIEITIRLLCLRIQIFLYSFKISMVVFYKKKRDEPAVVSSRERHFLSFRQSAYH